MGFTWGMGEGSLCTGGGREGRGELRDVCVLVCACVCVCMTRGVLFILFFSVFHLKQFSFVFCFLTFFSYGRCRWRFVLSVCVFAFFLFLYRPHVSVSPCVIPLYHLTFSAVCLFIFPLFLILSSVFPLRSF